MAYAYRSFFFEKRILISANIKKSIHPIKTTLKKDSELFRKIIYLLPSTPFDIEPF